MLFDTIVHKSSIMKKYLSLFLMFSLLTLTSCEDIVECIINVRPELSGRELQTAYVDDYYFDTVTAQIKNEPFDNGYYYYFTVSGEIPRGIDVIYEYRRIIFEGRPLEPGRYTIRVSLTAEAENDFYYDDNGNQRYHDPLCSNDTSRVYTLVVR